jgi:flagellar biosynthesis protein FliP
VIDRISTALPAAGGSPVDLLVTLFLIGLLPLIAVSMTSFTRVVVVLGLLRSSIGAPSLPPNSVIVALAIMLTCVIMAPTLTRIRSEVVQPYQAHRMSPSRALGAGGEILRRFMIRQTKPADIEAFAKMSGITQLPRIDRAPLTVVAPAFLVGELRAAFAMGFALALPFAVVDIVVAAVLMSLGMYMVSPASIALPVKLLLFVVADGWTLIASALVASYR